MDKLEHKFVADSGRSMLRLQSPKHDRSDPCAFGGCADLLEITWSFLQEMIKPGRQQVQAACPPAPHARKIRGNDTVAIDEVERIEDCIRRYL